MPIPWSTHRAAPVYRVVVRGSITCLVIWLLGPAGVALGCGRVHFESARDGSAPDAGNRDTGPRADADAGTDARASMDAGRDAGEPDAGARDAGAPDAGPVEPPPGILGLGWGHTCARIGSTPFRCWGVSDFGQTGQGSTASLGDDETAAAVPALGFGLPVLEVTAGHWHTCVRLDGGRVRCWGWGGNGQLGYGNTRSLGDDESATTVPDVPLPGAVDEIAARGTHTCARLRSEVRCWGANSRGELGYGHVNAIGDDEPASAPGVVNVGGAAVEIASGYFHTCARLDTGRVRCWGWGDGGRLGYGNTTTIGDDEMPATAGDVPLGGAAIAIAAGYDHTCALLEGGRVRCWGVNNEGELGYGHTRAIGDDEEPASAGDVPLGGTAVEIDGGGHHTCARLTTGAVRCWGLNSRGQLGRGDVLRIGDDETPATAGDIPLGSPAFGLALGGDHTCARTATGLRCWGSGEHGQLGHGTTAHIGDDETPDTAGDVPL